MRKVVIEATGLVLGAFFLLWFVSQSYAGNVTCNTNCFGNICTRTCSETDENGNFVHQTCTQTCSGNFCNTTCN